MKLSSAGQSLFILRTVLELGWFSLCLLGPVIALVRNGAVAGVFASLCIMALWIAVGSMQHRRVLVPLGAPMADAVITLSCILVLVLSLAFLLVR